ncbi:MAG: hypothetical protein IPK16_25150 [Anaerolineales bacterium]|nr:hypothetical protein [Anaerolineales bacterium]
MNVEILALCDAANDSHGKLNLLGAFDSLWAKTTPAVHPMCTVAIRMRFSHSEAGEHRVAIHFIDDDGQMAMPPVEGAIQVQPKPEDTSAVANIVLNIQGLRLEHFGEYSVNLLVDGEEAACLPLMVRQAP